MPRLICTVFRAEVLMSDADGKVEPIWLPLPILSWFFSPNDVINDSNWKSLHWIGRGLWKPFWALFFGPVSMAGWHVDFAVISLSLYYGELCTTTVAQGSSPLCCLIDSNSNWRLWSKSAMQRPKLCALAFYIEMIITSSLLESLMWSVCHFNIKNRVLCRYTPLLHARLETEKCGYIRKCPCHIPLFCQYQWSIISCRYGDGCSFPPPQACMSLPVFTPLPWLAYIPCRCHSKPSG